VDAKQALDWTGFWDTKSQQATDFQATGRSVMDVVGFLYLIRECARALDLQRSDRLLDIGCGTGIVALALAPHVSRISACDISPGMVDRARRNLTDIDNISLSVGSITDTGQPDGAYDKVLCYSVIQYLPDEAALSVAFGEIRRVLKPGGRAFLAANPDPAARALNRSLLDQTLWLAPGRAMELARAAGFDATANMVHPRIWQTFYMYDLSLRRID